MRVLRKDERRFESGGVSIIASSEYEAGQKLREIRLAAEQAKFSPEDFMVSQYGFDYLIEAERRWKSFIYVMQCEAGPVKIGVAQTPSCRVFEIQTGNPYNVEVEALAMFNRRTKLETTAHKILSDKRMSGEWFDVTPIEAVSAIQEAAKRVKCLILPCLEDPAALASAIGQKRDLGQEAWI
jgi:hypothetical protein